MICDVDDIRKIRSISINLRDPAKIEPFIFEAEHLDVLPVLSPAVYKMLDENMMDGAYISLDDGKIVASPAGEKFTVASPVEGKYQYGHIEDYYENPSSTYPDPPKFQYTGQYKTTYKYLNVLNEKYVKLVNGNIVILEHNDIAPPIDLTDIYYEYYYCNNSKHHDGLITAIAYFAYARLLESANTNVTAFGAVTKISEYSQPVFTPALKVEAENSRNIGKVVLRDVVDYIWYRAICLDDPDVPQTIDKGYPIKSVNIFACG